jgi:hypothetical protein
MIIELDQLLNDHATLTRILEERRAVTAVTLPVGVRLVWGIYLAILEDALSTLSSLISFLAPDQRQDPSPETHSTN